MYVTLKWNYDSPISRQNDNQVTFPGEFSFSKCYRTKKDGSNKSIKKSPTKTYKDILRWSTCVLVYFNWLLDHVIYLKLRRECLFCQAEQIHNMTTSTFTQNDNFVHPWQFCVSFCGFAQLYTTVILFSAWDKSHDPRGNWSKLKHM